MTPIQYIPLNQLRQSPRNARKTGGTNVDDLAASIMAEGILQNLVVTESDGFFDVEAGGRRLRALQALDAEGRLPEALRQVPCSIVTGAAAAEASLAENTIREAMHPADQFVAFRALIDAGQSTADVAARFGVSELIVRQRLKLANVNPTLFEIYRDGKMALDQLMALSITDNHEAQRQAWATATGDWERAPNRLREYLTQREVSASSRKAQLVGLDAYTAAGGAIRNDLFSAQAWLCDAPLLDSLVLRALEATADQERKEGWAWVEAHLDLDYSARGTYPIAGTAEFCELTPEQLARVDAIDSRISEIESIDADELDAEEDDRLATEQSTLEDEREAIMNSADETWPTSIKSRSGVLVFLGHSGIEIERGRLKPGQQLTNNGGVSGPGDAGSSGDAGGKGKPAQLSEAVALNLSAHRSEVARFHVMATPQLALALIVERLLLMHRSQHGADHPIKLQSDRRMEASSEAKEIDTAISGQIAIDIARLDAIPKHGTLAWLFDQPQQDLLQLLAVLVGQRFDGLSRKITGNSTVAAIHHLVAFDMADHWQPHTDGFLARIARPLILGAVAEAKGKAASASLDPLKKAELVAEASKQLAGTGWLPGPLRSSAYGKSSPPAATDHAVPTLKRASKKSASKKASAAGKAAAKKTSTKPVKPAKKAASKQAKKAAKP